MTSLKISIIVPIYNGERWIDKCLHSIYMQDIQEDAFEIICVDDNSSDKTWEVLQRYSKDHANLRSFHNETNVRAGGSRNRGVKEARGKYIAFIDVDDYYEPHTLGKALQYIEDNALDILTCEMSRESVKQVNNTPVLKYKYKDVMTGVEFLSKNSCPHGPTKYIFRRDLMVDNAVWFAENTSCEDIDWCFSIVYYAQRIQFLPLLIYHYVLQEMSQTSSISIDSCRDMLFAGHRISVLPDTMQLTSDLTKHCWRVAVSYWDRALNYYIMCRAPIREKSEMIRKYAHHVPHNETKETFLMRFAISFPVFFSFITNLMSPIGKLILNAKRYYKGR